MSDNQASWYVRNKGRVVGPFNPPQLEALRRRGQISRVTEVSADRALWAKASSLDWLFEAEVGAEDAAAAPEFTVTSPSATGPAFAAAGANPDPKAGPSDGVAWYYNNGDTPCGPVGVDELRRLASGGQINAQTLVWNPSLPNWSACGQVLDLGFGGTGPVRGKGAPQDDPFGVPGLDFDGPTTDEGYGILEPIVGLAVHGAKVVKHIFTAQMLKRRAVRWTIGVGLFPLALLLAVERFHLEFAVTAWMIAIYFSLFVTAFFYGVMRPTTEDWNRGLIWALFTVLLGIPLVLAAQADTPFRYLYQKLESENLQERFLGYFLGVGVVEEIAKVLPFFLFSIRKGERLDLRTGLFLGMICGFGFAIAETVNFYLKPIALSGFQSSLDTVQQLSAQGGDLDAEALAAALQGTFIASLLSQIVRFICLPLLHASWSAINGWFIASASQRPSGRTATIAVGILFTALLHGTYDTFVGSDSLEAQAISLTVATVSLLAFMAHLSMALDAEKAVS